MTENSDCPIPSPWTVEHRVERTLAIGASPEQVWDAITTEVGLAAWMVPARVNPTVGGEMAFELGEDLTSTARITAFEPPYVLRYEEPDWPVLAGQDPGSVAPMATEFLIEAASGGSCVVRIVTSAFGAGADWENEFFTSMSSSWLPLFDNLRLYATHYPGLAATVVHLTQPVAGRDKTSTRDRIVGSLGTSEVGQTVMLPAGDAMVERCDVGPLLFHVQGPSAALVEIEVWGDQPDTVVELAIRNFGDTHVDTAVWTSWLTEITGGSR
jgi:uncharacterized protein YndB with AHSA1/START domain